MLDVKKEAVPAIVALEFGDAELSGREVEKGGSETALQFVDRQQKIILARRKNIRIGNRAGSDDARHLAPDKLNPFPGLLGLIADCNFVTLAQKTRDVAV